MRPPNFGKVGRCCVTCIQLTMTQDPKGEPGEKIQGCKLYDIDDVNWECSPKEYVCDSWEGNVYDIGFNKEEPCNQR